MDKKTLFWLSGAGSAILYTGLLAVLIFNFFVNTKKVPLAGENITVDLVTSEAPQPSIAKIIEPIIAQKEPVPNETKKVDTPTVQKPVEKEPSMDTAKNILKKFSHPEPTKTPQKPIQNDQPTQKTPSLDAKQLLSSLTLRKNTSAVTFAPSGAKSNEYLGKVASIIKSGWTPYKSDIGLSTIIIMHISGDGKFDFTIKKQSPNNDFNNRLMIYLNDLKSKGLPPTDDKKSISVEFNFIAKE